MFIILFLLYLFVCTQFLCRVFDCWICFICSMTVTSAVKKSLFEYLVKCNSDELDEKQMTFMSKVLNATIYCNYCGYLYCKFLKIPLPQKYSQCKVQTVKPSPITLPQKLIPKIIVSKIPLTTLTPLERVFLIMHYVDYNVMFLYFTSLLINMILLKIANITQ